MAANNPRKFEEKIAQHKLRQAQETKEFDMIMQEMSRVTAKVNTQKQMRDRYGGSLPDFNAAQNHSRNENLNELPLHRNMDIQVSHKDRAYHPRNKIMSTASRRHNIDTPYHHHYNPYLSPPQMDANWRRTSSDSSIYQNLTNPNGNRKLCASPDSTRDVGSYLAPKDNDIDDMKLSLANSGQPQQQPQQTFNYPSNNGSLPDLSSLHLPSPLSVGLDQDEQQFNQNFSPASSNVFRQPRRNTTGSSSKRQVYRHHPVPTLDHMATGYMFQQQQPSNTSNPTSPTGPPMYQAPMSPLANGPGYLQYPGQLASNNLQVQQLEQMATIAENMKPSIVPNGQLGQNITPQSPNAFLNLMSQSPGAMDDIRQRFQDCFGGIPGGANENSLASDISNAIVGLDGLRSYPAMETNPVGVNDFPGGLNLTPLDISDFQVLGGQNVTRKEVEEAFRQEGNQQQTY